MRRYTETDGCLMRFLRTELDDAAAIDSGRCANCRQPISPRYLVIELITGLAFLTKWIMVAFLLPTPRPFLSRLPDPETAPEFYSGVRMSRGLAWLMDMVLIALVCALGDVREASGETVASRIRIHDRRARDLR